MFFLFSAHETNMRTRFVSHDIEEVQGRAKGAGVEVPLLCRRSCVRVTSGSCCSTVRDCSCFLDTKSFRTFSFFVGARDRAAGSMGADSST